ncbi:DUF393 domain-containing protein [Candidatus Methylacidiphilum infernorum]|uniref:DUF393 domain-containing protein n=1 Tax=Candidatus Methylacidiphilum infernorum TaxID=511746 RepID=A0ABX7PYB1_9BACT|nr:DCC1-like thiol-disulfide oxidoreductase family protein [Candidatus Methylacidiphilum infernorum]QSR87633.1 DUF393 domain-containing protein [Candidatus Methylacidiphilum infernorum]
MDPYFTTPDLKEKQIIFFDGICSLCNAFVSFVFSKDKEHHFFFASRQGKLFEDLKAYMGEEEKRADSIVLCRNQKGRWEFFIESRALIEILKGLPGLRWIATILSVFPRPFLDRLYRLVANNRYRLFGKRESCRLPSPEEKAYFLD